MNQSQLDIEEYIAAHPQNWRARDPSTSREAGIAAVTFKGADQEQIFQVMRLAKAPLAAEQISDVLGWDDHVRVNRRLKELATCVLDEYGALVRGALIERTEQKHINKSGRAAFKYRVLKP